MFAPLSDIVTCPRCGPGFGLIMLADRVADRRAYEAWLGCANCRERYRVQGGFADLSYGEPPALEEGVAPSPAEAARVAALLGVAEGPALLLVAGPGAVNAALIADMIEGVEVIGAWSPLVSEPERVGVSRFAGVAGVLPYRSGTMQGVVLTGGEALGLIEEAARVVKHNARVVVVSDSHDVAERLERAGMQVLAKDERAVVARRTSF